MRLPEPLAILTEPLFEGLPVSVAMPVLVPKGTAPSPWVELVEKIAQDPTVQNNRALEAGLWLYVDELDRSHTVSQSLTDSTGSMWHGIMHRREGDFWNSKYWFRQAGRHPAMTSFDSSRFVDDVERDRGANAPELLERQRQEWAMLFLWCAQIGAGR